MGSGRGLLVRRSSICARATAARHQHRRADRLAGRPCSSALNQAAALSTRAQGQPRTFGLCATSSSCRSSSSSSNRPQASRSVVLDSALSVPPALLVTPEGVSGAVDGPVPGRKRGGVLPDGPACPEGGAADAALAPCGGGAGVEVLAGPGRAAHRRRNNLLATWAGVQGHWGGKRRVLPAPRLLPSPCPRLTLFRDRRRILLGHAQLLERRGRDDRLGHGVWKDPAEVVPGEGW